MTKNRLPLIALVVNISLGMILMVAREPERQEGSLSGSVREKDGGVVQSALVKARHKETGITTIGLTNGSGEFRMPRMEAGEYRVQAEKKGYQADSAKDLTIENGLGNLVLGLGSLPGIPVSQLSNVDFYRFLPDAPAKAATVGTCGDCHSFKTTIVKGSRDRAEWSQVIGRMIDNVWQYTSSSLTERAAAPIVDYLASVFGPGSVAAHELGERVKQGRREELPIGHDLMYREYDVPTPVAAPHTAVPDGRGNVWFSEFGARKIGKLEISTGKVVEYSFKTMSFPHGLTVGPDGMVWIPCYSSVLGRFDPRTEVLEELRVPHRKGRDPMPHSVIVAENGTVWFTEVDFTGDGGSISSFDPITRKFERYLLGRGHSPYGIIEHGDGKLWFAVTRPGKVGFLDTKSGEIEMFTIPTAGSAVRRLRFDAKGRLWFGEYATHKIGMFDPVSKRFVEYDLPFRGSPYSLYVDTRTGYVWIASFDRDSFIRFDPDTKEMVEYPLPGFGVHVRDIWPDEDGGMWFAQWGRNKVTVATHLLE